jgi:hypothetical protein
MSCVRMILIKLSLLIAFNYQIDLFASNKLAIERAAIYANTRSLWACALFSACVWAKVCYAKAVDNFCDKLNLNPSTELLISRKDSDVGSADLHAQEDVSDLIYQTQRNLNTIEYRSLKTKIEHERAMRALQEGQEIKQAQSGYKSQDTQSFSLTNFWKKWF